MKVLPPIICREWNRVSWIFSVWMGSCYVKTIIFFSCIGLAIQKSFHRVLNMRGETEIKTFAGSVWKYESDILKTIYLFISNQIKQAHVEQTFYLSWVVCNIGTNLDNLSWNPVLCPAVQSQQWQSREWQKAGYCSEAYDPLNKHHRSQRPLMLSSSGMIFSVNALPFSYLKSPTSAMLCAKQCELTRISLELTDFCPHELQSNILGVKGPST